MSNPLTVAVELFHYAMWQPTTSVHDALPPHFRIYLLVAVAIVLATLVLGQLVFRRFERSFAQDL